MKTSTNARFPKPSGREDERVDGDGAKGRLPILVLAAFAAMIAIGAGAAWGQGMGSALGYHGAADRSGRYVVPGLTWRSASQLHLDGDFDGRVEGDIYAQPLYWQPPGASSGRLVVATESNIVYALDANSGRVIWRTPLGTPVQRRQLPCGNIDPLGVTGTPVIDPSKGAVYLDAMVSDAGVLKHLVYGLSLRDGAVLPGWPVDVAAALATRGAAFPTRVQNQRGALALLEGRLFVPYGGHNGDCGDYRGWVVGFALDRPGVVGAWSTRSLKGGIWAPGGIALAEGHLFVTTGNTHGARQWGDGEAVIRLAPDLKRSDDPRDFFVPSDWLQLDDDDLDLGGVSAIPVDLRGRRLMVALGKDGKAYLLDRDNLGGIGGALDIRPVSRAPIVGAPAAWSTGDAVFVAFRSARPLQPCAGNAGGAALAVLRVDAVGKGGLKSGWCRRVQGGGSPITTTSDGSSERIVWMVGAQGDDRLHGFRADTGEPVFEGGAMDGLRHFATIVAANGRLYVAADGRIYAFAVKR